MSNEAPTDGLRLVPIKTVKAWKAKAENRFMTSSLDEYCPEEFLTLAEAYIALAAAPASPLPGGGWQDISTAPKDGTEVLVMLKPKVIRLGWYFKPSSRTEGWCDENGKRIIPSHWMPLPAAPTGEPK